MTINNFAGGETGGTEEIRFITGTVTLDSAVKDGGAYSWKCAGGATKPSFGVTKIETGTSDGGNKIACGFSFRVATTTPTNQSSIMRTATDDIRLELATNGDIEVWNAGRAALAGTITNPLTANTWHYIEIMWDELDTGAAAKVFIDGVEKISITGEDFNGISGSVVNTFQGFDTASEDCWFDNIYIATGLTDENDLLGKPSINIYQNTVEDATDIGDTLEVGTWADVGTIPVNDGTLASYTSAAKSGGTVTDEGARSGPNGDGLVNIKAAKWSWRMNRGAGGGTTHYIRFGNSGDGMTDEVVALETSLDNYHRVSESATHVPLATEYFQQGFRVDGAQDIECSGMWAQVMHFPSVGGAYTAPKQIINIS